MAVENPTRDGRVVTLTIPAGNEAFLRRLIGAAHDGLGEDLDEHAETLERPLGDALREEMALLALLEALEEGEVVPGPELRATLARLAEAVDRDNEYDRVVAEHDALAELRGQLEGVPV